MNIKEELENLRKLGWKVSTEYHRPLSHGDRNYLFQYRRKTGFVDDVGEQPATRGGLTIVTLINEETKQMVKGEAYCSKQDGFCYAIGKKIALYRAKLAAGLVTEKNQLTVVNHFYAPTALETKDFVDDPAKLRAVIKSRIDSWSDDELLENVAFGVIHSYKEKYFVNDVLYGEE